MPTFTQRRTLLGGIFLLALSCLAPRLSAESRTGILFRTVTIDGRSYRYEVYVPPAGSPRHKWPVILFLHGIGHRGQYPAGSNKSMLARLFLGYQKLPQAVIVFPRCPTDATWTEPRMEKLALKALEQSVREFRGDPHRVYLTGLSMGGYGAWYIASRNPGRFAALAPVCGGIRAPKTVPLSAVSTSSDPYADVAKKVGSTPVWIFHGSADEVISVDESRRMANAMKAAGAEVRYTEYPGVGHNSWDKAYAEPDLIPWLLSKTLSQPTK